MRIRSSFILTAVLFFSALDALPESKEDLALVKGKYSARGNLSAAGIKVRYTSASLRVTGRGRIRGFVTRVLGSKDGSLFQESQFFARGHVSSVSRKGGHFSAKAQIRFADGTRVRGFFQGSNDSRLSRFLRGKLLPGGKNGSFKMQSR